MKRLLNTILDWLYWPEIAPWWFAVLLIGAYVIALTAVIGRWVWLATAS